jgi:hypothetical protein
MSDAVAERRGPRWVGRAFLVVVVALLVNNVVAIVRNQTDDVPYDHVGVVPRDLWTVALHNPHPMVHSYFRWFHTLRVLGPDATLVVPRSLAWSKGWIEEISRLGVEVGDPPLVFPEVLDHLAQVAHEVPGEINGDRPCPIVVEPGARRYLLVFTHPTRCAVVTPARYRELVAWFDAGPWRDPAWLRQLGRRILPGQPPFYWYRDLRRLGAGTTLVIAPEMAGHQPYLEQLSGLRVEVADVSNEIDPRAIEALGVTARDELDPLRDCVVVVEPGATRFIVARTPDYGLYVVLTEARYRQALADFPPAAGGT